MPLYAGNVELNAVAFMLEGDNEIIIRAADRAGSKWMICRGFGSSALLTTFGDWEIPSSSKEGYADRTQFDLATACELARWWSQV